ncbi:LOW QUALITY PROTEIN: E3 ubiquitin-protein ligase RNF125 [Aegotheles albertisi]
MGWALGGGSARGEQRRQPAAPCSECTVCPEVPHRRRAPCGHVSCHSCISASLKNNVWTCPYCHAYLPSEGIPATDIAKKMESTYNCAECETWDLLEYSCPYCQCEVDEDELMDHSHHRLERRAVCCPICYLTPGRDPSYFSRNFIRHLQLRHRLHYVDYIASNGICKLLDLIFLCDINTVGVLLLERGLDGSFLEYVHVSHPNGE